MVASAPGPVRVAKVPGSTAELFVLGQCSAAVLEDLAQEYARQDRENHMISLCGVTEDPAAHAQYVRFRLEAVRAQPWTVVALDRGKVVGLFWALRSVSALDASGLSPAARRHWSVLELLEAEMLRRFPEAQRTVHAATGFVLESHRKTQVSIAMWACSRDIALRHGYDRYSAFTVNHAVFRAVQVLDGGLAGFDRQTLDGVLQASPEHANDVLIPNLRDDGILPKDRVFFVVGLSKLPACFVQLDRPILFFTGVHRTAAAIAAEEVRDAQQRSAL